MNIAEGTTSDGTIFVNLHNLVRIFFFIRMRNKLSGFRKKDIIVI